MTFATENNAGARLCALILGSFFLFIGIAGFIPAFVSLPPTNASYIPPDMAHDAYSAGFGYLFGLFPTNLFHNIVHCIVGLFGLAAATDPSSSRVYDRIFTYAYVGIALLGLLPATNSFFGLMPIFGNNVWLNALTAAIAGYYGFVKPNSETSLPTNS